MGDYDGIGSSIVFLMWMGLVGIAATLGLGAWGLWWLFHHVSLAVK